MMALVFKQILTGLCDLVYPPNCLTCKRQLNPHVPNQFLCLHCQYDIDFNRPPFCILCSRYLGSNLDRPLCKTCRQNKPYFDFAWGACLYNKTIQKLIHKFKYNQKTLLRHNLARFIITFIKKYNLDIEQFDIITPIPLHATRQRERGYNQSQLLTEQVACSFNIPIETKNLIRTRHTPHQTSLREKERWTNIKGAFKIKRPDAYKNKAILLMDDLMTTGATASEAALILKQAGARTVGVLTLAIVPQNQQP